MRTPSPVAEAPRSHGRASNTQPDTHTYGPSHPMCDPHLAGSRSTRRAAAGLGITTHWRTTER
jgi:hypothetical protein